MPIFRGFFLRHNAPVRSLVALLVVLLVPLQLAFAGAGEYCESGKSHANHFGHHVHKTCDAQGKQPSDGKTANPDCAFCVLGCAHAQVSSFEVPAAAESAGFRPAHVLPLQGITPSVPDLPPRAVLA